MVTLLFVEEGFDAGKSGEKTRRARHRERNTQNRMMDWRGSWDRKRACRENQRARQPLGALVDPQQRRSADGRRHGSSQKDLREEIPLLEGRLIVVVMPSSIALPVSMAATSCLTEGSVKPSGR